MKTEYKQDVLYIVIPAYNEEYTIDKVVTSYIDIINNTPGVDKLRSKVVVAASGSVDMTYDLLSALQDKYDNLVLLNYTKKEHGPKLIDMYKYAIANGADYVFQTDSDDQVDPKYFERFWIIRAQDQAVLGWRKYRKDGVIRIISEQIVCALLWIYFGVSVPDANCPFRLIPVEMLKRHMYKIPKDYFIPNILLTACIAKEAKRNKKVRLKFKVIPFEPRKKGTNSVNLKKLFKIGIQTLADFYIFRKRGI